MYLHMYIALSRLECLLVDVLNLHAGSLVSLVGSASAL
jgi:hypothetical protein